eukprot:2409244-Ditylum_brightwellii.AAC.1
MGSVSDESSDDQMIHSKHAKVVVNICHTIKKSPLKIGDKGKRRAGRNRCKWCYQNGMFSLTQFYCVQCDAHICNNKSECGGNRNCWSEHIAAGGIKN